MDPRTVANELRPHVSIPEGHRFRRVPRIAAVVALVGLAGSAALAMGDPRQVAFSWLVAFLYFLGLALGGLYFVLIHFAVQGGWGVAVRRLAENAAATIPWFALLLLPILLRMEDLFPWSRPGAGADHLIHGKEPFLNRTFFFVRAAIYFAVWSGLALYYARQSRRQDESGDPSISMRLRRFAGPGLIALAVTQTFAAVDWIMSLDPHWYSTIFGLYFFAGSFVGFFALLAVVLVAMRRVKLLDQVVGVSHFHDVGKMVFAFTVFWAYIGFSQYFLIWYGNIPEETVFFLHRSTGSWRAASLLLAVGHFAIPFLFFLPRSVKRDPRTLALGSAWILLMHFVDLHWLVMPSLHPHGIHFGAADVAALLAVGGCFFAAASRLTASAPLVPLQDPRLPESLALDNS